MKKGASLLSLLVMCVSIIIVIMFILVILRDSSDIRISKAINPDRNYLIVVNSEHPYNFAGHYEQALEKDLICTPNIYGEAILVENAALVAFLELQHALERKNLTIGFYDAYRTWEDQQSLGKACSDASIHNRCDTALAPGYSEHHTGLLLSVAIWYQREDSELPNWYTGVSGKQTDIKQLELLHETLADYGFVDRYPFGKETITGMIAQPLEIRFVGSPATAHAIMDDGLTIEEYLNLKNQVEKE